MMRWGQAFRRFQDVAVVAGLMRAVPLVRVRLVAPTRPPLDLLPREQLQVRRRAAPFDQAVLLVGLARVLLLAADDDVHLRPARRLRPQTALDAEEDQLCHIAEVETDAPAVRAA